MADRILVIISRKTLSTPVGHPLGVEIFSELFLLRICWCVGACHSDLASVAICRTFFLLWSKHWHAMPEPRHAVPERWHAVPERWNAVPERWNAMPERWHAMPERWNAVQECWNAVPERWHAVAW
jgi:hypothetical protein